MAKAKNQVMEMSPGLHRNPTWLRSKLEEGLWYGPIAKECEVKPSAVAKQMKKHRIFTKVPSLILEGHTEQIAVLEERFQTKCIFHDILMGNPAIKKNSKIMTRRGVFSNANYEAYETVHLEYLAMQRELQHLEPINYPVLFIGFFYKQTKMRTDISNLYEAPQDIMVQAGLLDDDNSSIIIGHDGSRVRYDKLYPRTEIYILKANDTHYE